jgi:broad specificity phosphatase PhoE
MDIRSSISVSDLKRRISDMTIDDSVENPFPAPTYNPQINQETHVSESYSFFGDVSKLILVMVGLPARGKTFISRKIARYLTWLGYQVKSFNIGQYRRRNQTQTVGNQSAKFFDPNNEEAVNIRNSLALLALDDLMSYLEEGGDIAILDGTNSTLERRKLIRDFFVERNASSEKYKIVYIESVCTDQSIVEGNIQSCKLSNPDYKYVDPELAIADFRKRIAQYETVYVPVKEEEGAYIKIINGGKGIQGHEVQGYLPGRILYFLMHLNLSKKSIFLTRHGESQYNESGQIGGNAPLSHEGLGYADKLADFIYLQPESRRLKIFCSTLQRTIQTASPMAKKYKMNVMKWRALSEIEVGKMDGLTMTQFKTTFPGEYKARQENKLTYRYPGGESYRDVIQRLEPVIFELERATHNVCVVGHRAVLRCLYAYFVDCPEEDIPWLPIKLHEVYKLIPQAYDTGVNVYQFGAVASEHKEGDAHTRNVQLPTPHNPNPPRLAETVPILNPIQEHDSQGDTASAAVFV